MFVEIIYCVCLGALIIASISDIKTREVPDWLNFSLLFVAGGLRLIFYFVTGEINYIYYGLFGFGVFLLLSLFLFYTGQWGGGDSKMLMGLGALLGFDLKFDSFLIRFFVFFLVAGAVYGILWSVYLSLKNWKAFSKDFIARNKKHVNLKKAILVFSVVFIGVSFILPKDFRILVYSVILVCILTMYLWFFVKSVEEVCMLKWVKPDMLTEGDWIVKDFFYKGKKVCGPKDLGINKKQIALLKKYKVKKILIKEGIPFIPSFLFAFILALYFKRIF